MMMISGCDCDDDANDSVLGGLVIFRMGELLLLLAVCKRVVWESVVVVLGSDGSSRLITVAII